MFKTEHSFDDVVSRKSLNFIHQGAYLWKFPSEARFDERQTVTSMITKKKYPQKCDFCSTWISSNSSYQTHLKDKHIDKGFEDIGDAMLTEEISIEDLLRKLGAPHRYFFKVDAKTKSLIWKLESSESFNTTCTLSLLGIESVKRGIAVPGLKAFPQASKSITLISSTERRCVVLKSDSNEQCDLWFEGIFGKDVFMITTTIIIVYLFSQL